MFVWTSYTDGWRWRWRLKPEVELLQTGICQVIIGSLMYVSLGLNLVIIRQAVHFVNENLKVDVWIYSEGSRDCQMQPAKGFYVVILQIHTTDSKSLFWWKVVRRTTLQFSYVIIRPLLLNTGIKDIWGSSWDLCPLAGFQWVCDCG